MSDTYGADAPLVPDSTPSPDVNQQAQTGGLADSWRSWMADPHNRAAMIQFGVALSQPTPAGQNTLGQIGQAFGQAGEASDRITAEQQREQELSSKQELRGAQAQLYGERAAHQGDIAAAKTQVAEATLARIRMTGDVAALHAYTTLQGQYNKYRADAEKANRLGTTASGKPEPIQSWDDYFASNSRLNPALGKVSSGGQLTGGGGGGGGGDLVSQAQDAIDRGADRAAVIQRLRQQGGDPSQLR